MSRTLSFLAAIALITTARAQDTYYPPTVGTTWATTDPASLGWCTDELPALLDFLESSNSKAFIVLKDGRIVIEEYFGTFTADSSWYWASAGKSLTAFLVGLAQQQGQLDIDEPSSTYLGEGWTSCTPEQEAAITIRSRASAILRGHKSHFMLVSRIVLYSSRFRASPAGHLPSERR